MGKYYKGEYKEPTYDDIVRLERLLNGKKLTEQQKVSLEALLRFYYRVSD